MHNINTKIIYIIASNNINSTYKESWKCVKFQKKQKSKNVNFFYWSKTKKIWLEFKKDAMMFIKVR